MDDVELLPEAIAEALAANATVVTGNQRAARTLQRAFDQKRRSLGLSSWQSANILAWDAWTVRLWQRLLLDGHVSQLLMTPAQELSVWRRILEADSELESLRSKDSLAMLASDAWEKLCSHNGKARLRRSTASSDSRAFQRWVSSFQRRCRNDDLLSQAELLDALHPLMQAGHLQFETPRIALVGFDKMTPAQSGFIDAIRSTGCQVEELQYTIPAQATTLAQAGDEQRELVSAAEWVRRYVEAHPGARVAVVVPSLVNERAEIDRVFRDILAPEAQNIATSDHALPYEFSLGVPLAETQMVKAAMSLLQWTTKPLPIDQVTHLLLSPYFAPSTEQGARAEFDAFELRRESHLRPAISLASIDTVLRRSRRRLALGFLPAAVRDMRSKAVDYFEGSDHKTYAAWAANIRDLLRAARWGAPIAESSIEFQTRRKWESALDDLTTLDFDGTRVPFNAAFDSLNRILRQTMFAPESHDAPVQIMGPFETTGSTFDAIWFLRAGESTWPTATTSNPLLPWQLKNELGIPGADVALDSDFTRQVVVRISQSATTVVFSYARQSSEGLQGPSPTLKQLSLIEIPLQQLPALEPRWASVDLETIEDSDPIPPPPDRVVHGGTKVLQLQAACGFRAFAELRLWSTDLESVDPGMDDKQRGNLVHHVLESFWKEVKTQSRLRNMSTLERDALLDGCISLSLQEFAGASETSWDRAYLAMQHERLRSLLIPWLHLELRRKPFEVELSEKRLEDVRIGPLRLNVRMDRVDKIDEGEVLIDYKTGPASPNDWLSERPDAPQLPLYAVLSDSDNLRGVAFGIVRAGEDLDLFGYGTTEGVLPHQTKLKAASLEEQIEDWRRVLTDLAERFYSGDASVAPKKYPKTCRHCAQRILCRLDTSLLEEDEILAAEVESD